MTPAETVLVGIIRNKCEHVENFMDDNDHEAARQTLEEIQEFCDWLEQGKIANIPADTDEKKGLLFDMIVTRQIDRIL